MLPDSFYGNFYNPNRLISIDRMFNLSLGVRRIGKSTAFSCHDVYYYAKNKSKKKRCLFMYVRRNKDELADTMEDFISVPLDVFGLHDMKVIEDWDFKKGSVVGEYYLDIGDGNGKELAGYALPLSLAHKAKSKNFSAVKNVFYDEMIPEDNRYLGGKQNPYLEHTRIMGLLNTIDREPGLEKYADAVRFVGVGNIQDYMIPSVMELGADKYLNPEAKLIKPKGVNYCIEQTLEVEATKTSKNSALFGLSNDFYKRYAFDGGTHDPAFIGDPVGKIYPLINLKYLKDDYGVYIDDAYNIFVSHKTITGWKTLALTLEDHSINTMLITAWRDSTAMSLLREAYIKGQIIFESARCRFVINQYMMYGGKK